MNIWLDLDGVIANFKKKFFDHTGKEFDDSHWGLLEQIPNFFLELELMPDAMELVDYLKDNFSNIKILTAVPRRTTMPHAEKHKHEWVKKHLGDIPFFIGPHGKDKWKHCKSTWDILIDDTEKNINEWRTLGNGIGVHHVSAKDTIEQLEKWKNFYKKDLT